MTKRLGGTKRIENGRMVSILLGEGEREIIERLGSELGRSEFIREAICLADKTEGRTDYSEENTKLRTELHKAEMKLDRVRQDWKNEKKELKTKKKAEKKAEMEIKKRRKINLLKETAKERGWEGKQAYEDFLSWMDLDCKEVDDIEKRKEKDALDDRGMYF